MTWKAHPTTPNLEINGSYVRPKIHPRTAYMSGLNGGTYGQYTHEHAFWAAGQAHAYKPKPNNSANSLPTGNSSFRSERTSFTPAPKRNSISSEDLRLRLLKLFKSADLDSLVEYLDQVERIEINDCLIHQKKLLLFRKGLAGSLLFRFQNIVEAPDFLNRLRSLNENERDEVKMIRKKLERAKGKYRTGRMEKILSEAPIGGSWLVFIILFSVIATILLTVILYGHSNLASFVNAGKFPGYFLRTLCYLSV